MSLLGLFICTVSSVHTDVFVFPGSFNLERRSEGP